MTEGVLLFANNNAQVDYVKQSIYCAKKIKQHLKLDVAVVTPDHEYLKSQFPFYKKYIDHIITAEHQDNKQTRRFRDGAYSEKKLQWNNHGRSSCYDLTPFDKTLVMDTDYIICNNILKNAFESKEHFMLYKDYTDLLPRKLTDLDFVSDKSIPMYWATVFYFDKSPLCKMFFDLVQHVRENWNFYRLTYQIAQSNYRNDYAFSIAIHIMNGFEQKQWPIGLPGKMYLTTDYDILHKSAENKFSFLIDKDLAGNYTAATIKDSNIHIMNKFSLGRHIDSEFENE